MSPLAAATIEEILVDTRQLHCIMVKQKYIHCSDDKIIVSSKVLTKNVWETVLLIFEIVSVTTHKRAVRNKPLYH